MIIEVTRETTTIRWQEVPIPSRCEGCPYPHVGFTCRDRDGSCLRTDVEQLTERQKKRRKLEYLADVLDSNITLPELNMPVYKTFPQADVTYLDYSPDMMAAARQRAKAAGLANVRFQQGDVGALPFESSSFDLVVELGAGLSCLRRQMGNDTNPWYCLDMANVIALREKHIPQGEHEHNVVCDLNDFSWFDKIRFDPAEGIVFTAGGLFYYFEKEQVRRLLCAMAERFPGGMITFDAVNALGLKGVNAEVGLAGNKTKSFFSLERPKEELEGWSDRIIHVKEKDYADGYLKGGYRKTPITRLFNWVMWTFHISFMLYIEFR